MTQPRPLITFRDVALGYTSEPLLRGISFVLFESDVLGIVGPNGAGKTTLLRAMLGILKPLHGSIDRRTVDGRTISVGYAPQRDTIDQIMPFTVSDVVMMGRYGKLGMFRWPGKEDQARVHDALESVGMLDQAGNSFRELSGGQKQRVLIARALVTEPDILVLDEPTNGMDLSSRTSILSLIRSLRQTRHLTVVMVSHLLTDVASFANRLAIVESGIFQVGPKEEILTARNLSEVYHMPVEVHTVSGSTIIIPRSSDV